MKKKRSFWDRLMTAVKARDEEAVKAELEAKDAEAEEAEKKEEMTDENGEQGKPSCDDDPMAAYGERLAKIEAILAKLVPAEEAEHGEQFDADEENEETADTVIEAEQAGKADTGTTYTGDSMKQIVARAEILAPGIAVPTGDAIKSKDAAPKLMKKALETAMGTEQGKACVEPFLMGRKLTALTGDSLLGVFNGAAELMRVRNNDRISRAPVSTKDFGRATSVSDINARNREFWAKRSAAH